MIKREKYLKDERERVLLKLEKIPCIKFLRITQNMNIDSDKTIYWMSGHNISFEGQLEVIRLTFFLKGRVINESKKYSVRHTL